MCLIVRRRSTGACATVCFQSCYPHPPTSIPSHPLAHPQSKDEGGGKGGRPAIAMPPTAPQLARHIFATCTQMDPELRPSAAQLVEWLRGGKVCTCCAV